MHIHNLIHFLLLSGSLLFISCKKEGPIGPAGKDGNANVRSGTVSLTNADWKWASTWSLSIGAGSTTNYNTRYSEINTDLITQEIADKGSVQVFFKPKDEGWVSLPYIFQSSYSINFMYEYMPGKIRLHYFWTPNMTGIPAGLGTHTIPNYTFKYVITAAR